MWYRLALRVLVDPDGVEFGYYHFDVRDEDDLEWPWMHGIRFADPPTAPIALRLDLEDEDAGDFADYVSGPIPMVTARLRKVLDACGVSNIDYYPVAIEGAAAFDDFPQYLAANIIGKVAAADPANSVYSEAFGGMGATMFDRLVLNPKAVAGLKVFVLAEHLTTVVVSAEIKDASEAAGIDTLRFIPLEVGS